MNLRPEEISSVIKEQIEKYSTKLEVSRGVFRLEEMITET